jgi:hypothetical protein
MNISLLQVVVGVVTFIVLSVIASIRLTKQARRTGDGDKAPRRIVVTVVLIGLAIVAIVVGQALLKG